MSRQLLFVAITMSICSCDFESQPLTGPQGIVRDPDGIRPPTDRARGYLGLYFESIDDVPLVIAGCVPDSGAESAGIRPGDLVIRLNGQDRPTFFQIQKMAYDSKPGDKFVGGFERDNQSVSITFPLISFDDVQTAMERKQSSEDGKE